MSRPVRDGFTPWPDELSAQYRAAGWWTGETLGALPQRWSQERPDATAIVDGEGTITYGELESRVRGLAANLQNLGLRGAPHGDRLLVQLPNSPELVVLALACFRIGVIPVLALPAHRRSEMQYLATFSEARAIAVPDRHRDFDHQGLAAEIVDVVAGLEHVLVLPEAGSGVAPGHVNLRDIAAPATEDAAGPRPSGEDIALMLLSGGTTGVPKLIPRTHQDYLLNIRATAEACSWGPDTRYLPAVPMAHNFGLGCPGVLGALEAGGQVVISSSPDPQSVVDVVRKHGVTDSAAVPAIIQRWMEFVSSAGVTLPSLRAVQVGGTRLAAEVAYRIQPVLGAKLQQGYGMAEGLVNYTRLDDSVDVACTTQGRPVSPGDEVRIVDADGNDVPQGERGELITQGPYTIRGYWRSAEHNSRAFTPEGWYRTGDVVRFDSTGNLVVEGRVKDMINRGGENVSAEEVENLLYGLVESVARVAVVSAPDRELGERVAAVVVPADGGAPPTLEQIRRALDDEGVARFKIPEVVHVVEELPLTKVGKVDKAALRSLVAQIVESD